MPGEPKQSIISAKHSTNAVFVELFLCLFCRMTRAVKQEKQNMSQKKTLQCCLIICCVALMS